MATGCHRQLTFWEIGRQEVIASFDGGRIVSDAGLLSLRQFEKELGILSNLASRFPDPRAQRYVTHTSEALLTQRVYQILADYADCNDAQALRHLSTTLAHLGNISQRVGRKLPWDAKTERVIGDDEANRFLGREYRKPFMLPEKV